MDVSTFKNIVNSGGGVEKVKIINFVGGANIVYADTLFEMSDVDEGNGIIHLRGRSDMFGNTYTASYDMSKILNIVMMDDVNADQADSRTIR